MTSDGLFRVTPFITLYALSHLAVDAACAFLLLGVLELNDYLVPSMLIYNAAAFVLQAPFGYFIDKALNPKIAAIFGLILVALSFSLWNNIFAALTVAGIGNALYHVGGGSLVLSLKNRKATFLGVFIAPGGIGLALGAMLSVSLFRVDLLLFPVVLTVLGALLYFVHTPEFIRVREKKIVSGYGVLIALLIVIPIVVRSMIGLSIDFPWKDNRFLYLSLIAAIALGKALGGVFSDRFGLRRIGVGGFLVSAPLLAFFSSAPVPVMAGLFLLNLTMPATLMAIHDLMPGHKGLAFGLTTVALFIGALPVIIGMNATPSPVDRVIFPSMALAATSLFAALLLFGLKRRRKV